MSSSIDAERIEHVALDVTDIDRSKRYYSDLLGLCEIPRPASFDFPGAWYQVGPEVLHLVGRATQQAKTRQHLALWVRHVHAAAERIAGGGCAVEWDRRYKIPGVDRFFTYDPDGNRIEI